MKASTPIFVHSQHPMQMFFLPPGWFFVCVLVTFALFILLQFLLPSLSMIISVIFFCAFYLFIKFKMGRDRHSDEVWRMGIIWRGKHRTNKLTVGEHQRD